LIWVYVLTFTFIKTNCFSANFSGRFYLRYKRALDVGINTKVVTSKHHK